ncbi:hypothetical protein M422DRAFT_175459 [Sphaerobolus stellatus SS14]|uniref:Enoyl reductase (ER) domain-containing protein n=1 Tax=Sphaerobolus stellatus (strain SS14) TaxID=990650 RepID=A0A0C9VMS1_SPHS4|nr:hypothetical protein M422DRAFT_175459 [Sphaerobolus stellatus SS14]
MAQQKALVLPEKGGNIKVTDIPIPKPGKNEILVKVHSTALNPADWKIQKPSYSHFIKSYPVIFGIDSAGIVEEIGDGVTKFQKGDKVFHQGDFFNSKSATFQQYTIVLADFIPSNLSFDQAATIPLCITSAAVGLYLKDGAGLQAPWEGGEGKYKDQSIVIFGGSSSVGQYAMQLAKLSGFSTIIATSSIRNADLVKSFGATHVVDRNADVVAEVKKILSDSPKIVWDAVSLEDTQIQAIQILASDGTLLLVGPPHESIKAVQGDRKVYRVYGSPFVHRELGISMYSKLTEFFESGKLKPSPVEVLPNGLAGILPGLQRLEDNKVSAVKLIARPQE